MRTLRTDRGFGKYCDKLDMQRQLTTPYSPQQNGVVERRNQTIVGIARSLLMTARMPWRFGREAVMTALYLLNWLPTQSLDGKTPHEA